MENREPKETQDDKPPSATKEDIEELEPPMGGGGGRGNMPKLKPLGDIKIMAVVSVIVAIVVFMGMGLFGVGNFVTKNDFTTNVGGIVTTMDKLVADMNVKVAEINTLSQSIPTTVSNAVVTSTATWTSQITSLSNQVSGLSSEVTNLSNSVNSYSGSIQTSTTQIVALQKSITDMTTELAELETKVADYESRLVILETEEEAQDVIDNEEPLTVTVKQQSEYLYVSDNQSVGALRIVIENKTNKIIEDVILGVGFTMSYGSTVTDSEVYGGALGWVALPYSNLYFKTSGWGYTIKANEKMTFDVIARFNDIGSVPYRAEAYVEAWSYK